MPSWVDVRIAVDGNCEPCRVAFAELEENGGSLRHPNLPKDRVLILVPGYNGPSRTYPDGKLTHWHVTIADADRALDA